MPTIPPEPSESDAPQSKARTIVSTRLSKAGVTAVDALATAEERTRSQMLRILIKEAIDARRWRSR